MTGRAVALLAAAVAWSVSCGVGGTADFTCEEMRATHLPEGFRLAERRIEGAGVLAVYRDQTGERELALLSGVPFDPHGTGEPTGQLAEVRGRQVEVIVSVARTRWVTWLEAPVVDVCHRYSVIGVGIDAEEFGRVLAGIR